MIWDTSDDVGIDLQAEIPRTLRSERTRTGKPKKSASPYVGKPGELCPACRRWLGKAPKKGRCDTCYRYLRRNGRDREPTTRDERGRP